MPYTKDRFELALRIIKQDIERRRAAEAETKARTQYRDDFNLRRPVGTYTDRVQVWRKDDSSDEDYLPKISRRRKSGKSRSSDQDEQSKKTKRPSQRRTKKPAESSDPLGQVSSDSKSQPSSQLDPTAAFITLKLVTQKGRTLLRAKIKEHPSTHINIYKVQKDEEDKRDPSGWRSVGSGLHNANKSTAALMQDFDTLQEELTKPRQLRSGRVCTKLSPKKRKLEVEDLSYKEGQTKKRTNTTPTAADATQRFLSEFSTDTTLMKVEDSPAKADLSVVKHDSPYSNKRTSATSNTHFNIGTSAADAIPIDSSEDEDKLSAKVSPSSSHRGSSSTSATSVPAESPNHSKVSIAMPTASEVITLKTSFAHPINFKSIHQKCTFHSDFRHPILGHGVITAQYLIYSDRPSQLIELGGGHTDNPHLHPPDIMCVSCSLSYLQIVRCTTHTFAHFSQHSNPALRDGGLPYLTDLMTKLKPGNPDRNLKPLCRTCSLCRVPASYKCISAQHHDKSLRPCALPHESIPAARARVLQATAAAKRPGSTYTHDHYDVDIRPPLLGCGLALCRECYDLVGRTCGGDLQRNRAAILRQIRARRMDARADVEFLFKEGLVYKAYYVDRG